MIFELNERESPQHTIDGVTYYCVAPEKYVVNGQPYYCVPGTNGKGTKTKYHRLDGPAVVDLTHENGQHPRVEYWIDGVQYHYLEWCLKVEAMKYPHHNQMITIDGFDYWLEPNVSACS